MHDRCSRTSVYASSLSLAVLSIEESGKGRIFRELARAACPMSYVNDCLQPSSQVVQLIAFQPLQRAASALPPGTAIRKLSHSAEFVCGSTNTMISGQPAEATYRVNRAPQKSAKVQQGYRESQRSFPGHTRALTNFPNQLRWS